MQRNADTRRLASFSLMILLCVFLGAPPILAQDEGETAGATASVEEEEDPLAADDEAADEDLLAPSFTVDDDDWEEIRVTTSKSELTANDEAVSVTQFGAADIQAFRIQDIADLSSYTPNLEINTAFAASNPTIFIRGIGLKDYNANSAGSVAVYTDNIYVNSPAGQLFQLFDTQSIEVLRGPQGSQSARNATAGAIKVYSNKPDGEFSGSTSVSYGEYNLFEFESAFGFPVFRDIVSARIAGTANFMDGTTQNKCRNAPPETDTTVFFRCDRNGSAPLEDVFPLARHGDFEGLKKWTNNVKNWAARGLLRIQPRDDVDLLFNVHWGQNRSDSRHLQMRGFARTQITERNGLDFSEEASPRFDFDPFVGWYDEDGLEELDILGVSMTLDWDLGTTHVTFISGYESNERLVEDEGDASPLRTSRTDWTDETWQITEELRVDGDGENYHWSAGGFVLYEEVLALNIFIDPLITRNTEQTFDQSLLTFAPYAHGTWEFNESWSVELGARYNWEKKTFDLRTDLNNLKTGLTNPAFTPIGTGATWAAPTGEFTVNFEPRDDVKFYLKYARGMKGGHFNGSSALKDQSIEPVEPEFVHSGEFGIKSTWLDGALGFNAAGFYYDYHDLQVFDLANEVGRPPSQQLLNADATAFGVEGEWQFRPVPELFVGLGFGWLDATFDDFKIRKQIAPAQPRGKGSITNLFDFSGNPLIAAPKFNLTGNVEYTLQAGRYGSFVPGFDFSYKSKVSLDPANKPQLQQPSYWILNARLAYVTPNERIRVSGWVRNFMKTAYLIDAFDQSAVVGQILFVYADPRLYGLTVSFDW